MSDSDSVLPQAQTMAELDVEQWEIDKVKPYAGNPRNIPDRAVETVMDSLRSYKWRQPIVVDEDGVIIVGHVRHMAAQALGYSHVPVHVASDLTPEQAREYRLADNRAGELTDWDLEMLAAEIRDMPSVPPGWDDDEVELLVSAYDPPDEQPDPNVDDGPQQATDGVANTGAGTDDDIPEGYVVIRMQVPRAIAKDVRDAAKDLTDQWESVHGKGGAAT